MYGGERCGETEGERLTLIKTAFSGNAGREEIECLNTGQEVSLNKSGYFREKEP